MSNTKVPFAYPRLCIAYAMLFSIWGSWANALGGYCSNVLHLSGMQVGWLYAAIPLGAVIAPMFIGPIADRYFPAQKVVSVLHFIGGLCLIACGALCSVGHGTFTPNDMFIPMMVLILLSGICFMPTVGLVNTIVMKHLPNPSMAPRVFVFGTIGWIFINLLIDACFGGAGEPKFFYVGGVTGILLSVYSLTLPNTPPKGAPAAGEKSDALGLGALQMFKDPSFAVFAICVFIASIPACNYFFAFQVTYLTQRGYPSPLALTTINQFSEIFFMAMLPVFVTRIGLKWVITIGMASWAVRYLCFMCPHFGIAIVGLLLHGLGYSFLYVAAYMYAERKAPVEIKASAQSLMVFLLLGIGQVGGSQLYGNLKDLPQNTPAVENMNVASTISVVPEKELANLENTYILPESTDAQAFWASLTRNNPVQPLPEWGDAGMINSAWRYLNLSATLDTIIHKFKGIAEQEHVKTWSELIDTNGDNKITLEELNASPETVEIGSVKFAKGDFEKVFRKIVKVDSGEFSITRQEYLDAQSSNWRNLFLVPSIWIAIFAVIFAILGREPGKEKTHNQDGPATKTHD
jgi:nucleoside transporter